MTDFLSLAAEGGFSHCAPLCMAAAGAAARGARDVRGRPLRQVGQVLVLPARLRHAGAGGIADCAL